MTKTNGDSQSRERALVHEVLAASGARPADNVTIAGTDHLEIMIELMRCGFSHVLCQSPDHGPHMATAPADIIVAPNVTSESALGAVVTRLGRDLRPRGVLVICWARPCSALSERRLRRLLMDGGFIAMERIAGRSGAETLWCAHKLAAPLRHAA
jgi:hypothetical protein